MARLVIGQTLAFAGDPTAEGLGVARHDSRGGVLIEGGIIRATDPADALRAARLDAVAAPW